MSPTATVRSFIALLPDEQVRQQLAAWRDAWTWPRSATPVKSARLHITLHFLGDVARDRIPELADALAVPFTPFMLHLDRLALWPHGIAVLEPQAVPDALLALHGALAVPLREQGLPIDTRPFRPHVTLARRAQGAVFPVAGSVTEWHIGSYALMASTWGMDGGYTILRTYPT